jgi:hypothetical protein
MNGIQALAILVTGIVRKEDSGPWGDNASKGNEENSNTEPQHSTSKDNKQT